MKEKLYILGSYYSKFLRNLLLAVNTSRVLRVFTKIYIDSGYLALWRDLWKVKKVSICWLEIYWRVRFVITWDGETSRRSTHKR
jgi:hypothetical protein